MERKEQQSLNEAVQGILGKTTQSDLDKLLTQLGTAIQDHHNVISSQVWRQTQKLHPSISHIPNPKYNKDEDWAKKHGVVTKILSGGKIEVKLDGEVLPTELSANELIKEK